MIGQFYTPKISASLSHLAMSKSEFDAAKGGLLANYAIAQQLVKYKSPLEDRKTQLADVGEAAVRPIRRPSPSQCLLVCSRG